MPVTGISISRVTVDSDKLTVYADVTRVDEIYAEGWVSATQNYYGPESYYPQGTYLDVLDTDGKKIGVRDVSGHLIDGSKPRPMTDAEVQAYYITLLNEQHAPSVGPIATEIYNADWNKKAIATRSGI